MYYIVQVELIVWGSQQHLYTFKWISGQMQPTLVVFFGIKVPSYQEKTSTDTFSHLRLLEKFFHLRLVNEEITCDHRAEQRTNNSDYWNFSKFSINFIFLVIITMSTHFNRVYCPHEQQQLETEIFLLLLKQKIMITTWLLCWFSINVKFRQLTSDCSQ